MIFAAFRHDEALKAYKVPMVVLTSRFGTVEMWDWEIVTYLRDLGLTVFSPYSIEMGKTVLRALGVKRTLKAGAKFLVFQDSPGEGMQAYLFKKFYWWERSATETMESVFGCKLIYRSWKACGDRAKQISDDEARRVSADWNVRQEGVCEEAYLRAVKIYIAVKEVIDEVGGVEGVGSNCLNEVLQLRYDAVVWHGICSLSVITSSGPARATRCRCCPRSSSIAPSKSRS